MANEARDQDKVDDAGPRSQAEARMCVWWLRGVVATLWLLFRLPLVFVYAITPHGRVPLSVMMLQPDATAVQHYAELAAQWSAGASSSPVWPLVILPYLWASDASGYRLFFVLQMLLVDVAVLLLLLAWRRFLGRPTWAAVAFYLLLTTLIAPTVVLGLHGFVALLLLGLATASRGVGTPVDADDAWTPWGVRLTCVACAAAALLWGPMHPQVLLWMAPSVTVLALWRAGSAALAWLSLIAFAATAALTRCLSGELLTGEVFPIVLRLLRDTALVTMMVVCAAPSRMRAAWSGVQTRSLPRVHRLRPEAIVVCLLFVWMAIASLSPVTENDIWWLMRVGKDVLATHVIPSVDPYSATAQGQPFAAHEWLTGVLFYRLFVATRGHGLSVLQMLLGLGCAALMFGAVDRQARRSVVFTVIFVASLYVVAFRVDLRPHVLSLLGLCYVAFALERWPTRRAHLVALVPLQLVWANLHGGAWLVPVLLFAVALGAVCDAWWRHPASHTRVVRKADALFLLLISAGTAVASLCNPYGWHAGAFALRMGSGQDFMMRNLSEWQPTLSLVNVHDYPFWAFMIIVAALWVGLALRARHTCMADLALALVATALGLRCVRFTAELVVLVFPLVVRTSHAVLQSLTLDATRLRRPWAEVAVLCVLITGTASYGYAFNALQHRSFGTGFAGDLPYAHVNYMRQHKFHGVVFNDYDSGGLISYSLYPAVRPVIDSRIEVFGAKIFEDYDHAFDDQTAFETYTRKHDVDFVLLAITPRTSLLLAGLSTSGHWQLLLDAAGYALLKRTGELDRHEATHAAAPADSGATHHD
ncbi:MAG: hypothetical protein SF187_08155 [Deltaproteobacteria bacterium]|nr:hypothetical protein [Deltaproteobacteria bacterium]